MTSRYNNQKMSQHYGQQNLQSEKQRGMQLISELEWSEIYEKKG